MSLLAASRWVDRQVADFALTPWQRRAEDEAFWASLKAIAELVHAGDYLVRGSEAHLRESGSRWIAHGWEQVGRGAIHRELLATPRFLPVVLTVVPFHLAGHVDPPTLDVIGAGARAAVLSPLEWTLVVPALDILGVDCPVSARALARERSVLGRATVDLAQDDQYILAHECFYASRWGHAPPTLDAPTMATLERVLPALVERARSAADADALAELLLASRCMRFEVDPNAFSVLAAACSADGNVVPSTPLHTRHRRFAHPTMSRTYHTTLASIMAWAAI